jgi:hypothetical protein
LKAPPDSFTEFVQTVDASPFNRVEINGSPARADDRLLRWSARHLAARPGCYGAIPWDLL